MKPYQPSRLDFNLDMTPMIDCVFQLLIFFLLSSSFLTPAVRLDLPDGSGKPDKPPETVMVTLSSAGELFIDKQPVEKNRLQEHLSALFQQGRPKTVTLRADKELKYETILQTILKLRQAGAVKVRLAFEDNS